MTTHDAETKTGEVTVSTEDDAIVLVASGRFDRRVAQLLDELVRTAAHQCSRVIVDLQSAGPATRDGLRLLPVIQGRATVRGHHLRA